MSEVLLFHHALGRTPGVLALADAIQQAGHRVHVPDLYAGLIFKSLDEGVRYAQGIGFDVLFQRAKLVADPLPSYLVYAGMSLGVLAAQRLTQTRPGAAGALFLEACIPVSEFSRQWPFGVPVQVHGMDHDPMFAGEGDLQNARSLVSTTADAELFLYSGHDHLFSDSSLPSYNKDATRLLMARLVSFLDRLHVLPA